MARILVSIIVSLLSLYQAIYADTNASLNQLLNQKEAPEGVVFEIVTGDDDALEWAIPRTREYIRQLRAKFPALPIAVVTHGQEMFSLQTRDEYGTPEVHNQVKSLVEQQDVVLHACGTYAGWRGLAEEDFPAYVDIAASGPAQINDYVAIGYVKVIIREED